MPQLGPLEILVILVVALVVFGPQRLPEIGRQVGKAVREFRRFQESMRREIDDVLTEDRSDEAEPAPTLGPKRLVDGVQAEGEDFPDAPSYKVEETPDTAPPVPPAGTV